MKKLVLLLPALFACKIERNYNIAEVRVKSEVVDAKCATGKLSDGTHVAKCTIGKDTILAAQGGDYPFHNWPFRTAAQLKEEAAAQKAAQQPAPSPPPTEVGSASK